MSSSFAQYEAFLVNNVSTISTLESTLRSLTWFLPGRFKDAELVSESLSALVNIMSMYHDTLLARVVANSRAKPLIPRSLHTKFTGTWSDRNWQYKWAARVLQLIRFSELVVEMLLRRNVSSKARWRGILSLEMLKAILRFMMLKITRRPILNPPIPERDFDPAMIPQQSVEPASGSSSPTLAASSPSSSPPVTPKHLRNNRMPLPPHQLLADPPPSASYRANFVEDYLVQKALTTSAVKPALSLVKPLSGLTEWLSEVIYIIRPLVYGSSRKLSTERAIVAAFALELISRNLRRNPPSSATLERAEYAKRDRDIMWYALRGEIWNGFTRPKLESLTNGMEHIPIMSLVSAFVKDWMPLIDEYYYYTAL
ncbi:peroxisome membrane protein [Fistulina hepatica ATCC 64428]|uniref:Peroxisomal membrane protein PEX16 n=1 Tax=Fistulina hepatica ATCC 64428 TaxID=1128425 RepID=A0A0D7AHZ1_9AGAR|nr:peroxisome membrane protein [Fistulina hepatica ATCC 64428]